MTQVTVSVDVDLDDYDDDDLIYELELRGYEVTKDFSANKEGLGRIEHLAI